MSSRSHFATAFNNNCVSRPRHPETNLPLTIEEANQEKGLYNESSFEKERRLLHERQVDEELERNRSDWYTDDNEEIARTESKNPHTMLLENDLTNLLQDDTKFYQHLQALRLENKKTLKMLERFYKSRPRSKDAGDRPRDFLTSMRNEVDAEKDALFANRIYDSIANSNTEESEETNSASNNDNYGTMDFDKHSVGLSSSDSEEDPRKDWPRIHSQNILPDDRDDHFRGRDFSYQVIDNMWDNFSVDNYAPVEKGPKEEPAQPKQWKPSITVPQPFNMTLREAAKAKVKSKRKEKLEKELLERKMTEEAELAKKFRARPLPATTFIKLYEEQKSEEEKKRQYSRSLNKAILEATQRPFNFMKREEEKKELRRSQSMDKMEKKINTKPEFKARPFPENLFSLSLEDKITEQNEYRKIKVKMRSEEMLANSSLPPNMRSRGERYSSNRRYSKKQEIASAKKMQDSKFRPNINHDVPDYEELHRKLEIDLLRKRKEKSPTICEPFNLHTAKVPDRRARTLNMQTPESHHKGRERSLERFRQSSSHQSSPSLRSSMPDEAPPYAMTETARMRHSINQDTLAKETKAREDEKKKTERRKRRELQLRQKVARRSIGNDLRRSLDKQNKEKLRSFRESEMARKQAYREYLREIKARVDQRPLLFEQESQTNAKRTAQRKYEQLLKEAGVDDDILEKLLTDDGKIVDADSEDDDTDDLLLSGEGVTDQSGAESNIQNANDTFVLDDAEGEESEKEVDETE